MKDEVPPTIEQLNAKIKKLSQRKLIDLDNYIEFLLTQEERYRRAAKRYVSSRCIKPDTGS